MAASVPVILDKKSQRAFTEYYKSVQLNENISRSEFRSRLEILDKAYMREMDKSQEQARAKAANTAGDPTRLQNITVPVVKPQVESAVEYQASVFLSEEPLFEVVSDPQYIDQALQMGAIIEEQALKGGWIKQFLLHFRDGFKFNFAPLEVSWDTEVTYAVETDLATTLDEGVPKKILWSGNKIKRLDPYNFFCDRTVTPSEVYAVGDYAGYTELMSRMQLKSFLSKLTNPIEANFDAAFDSSNGGTGATDAGSCNYYIPDINPLVDETDNKRGGTNWMRFAGLSEKSRRVNNKNSYEVTTLHCRILPDEMELSSTTTDVPQIYKLIFVNHEHIVYAQRQTNAHNMLPVLIGQPQEDGLGYQTKSLGNNAVPFQEAATTYMASIMASRRRAISDRVLYDPSKITSANINSANPSAKIPVRPSHFGKPLSEAVYPFPYREDQQASNMQQIQVLLGMSNNLAGQNQTSQGQFVKGNKTVPEFETTMNSANGSDRTASILAEVQVFTPLKNIIKLNILQYQAGTEIQSTQQQRAVQIDPVELRKAVFNFRVTDGLVPADKVINSEGFSTALQVIGSSPEVGAGYNLPPLFSYLLKTQGADISAFEKSPAQQAYEQAAAQYQQALMLTIDKGGDPNALPPPPVPADFGYDPQENNPSPESTQQAPGQAPGAPSVSTPPIEAPAPAEQG